MCLLSIACNVHPEFPLIVAANRDEFLDRPADPLHYWQDEPTILAGRDLRGGGTWMGLTTNGRFAALTNHRDLRRPVRTGPSRGLLVKQALLEGPVADTSVYEGFNLIHGPWQELEYHNNVNGSRTLIPPGIHGLSNAFLNTPWPKVERAKAAMARLVARSSPTFDDLFDLLADETMAEDPHLPDTGIGPQWEKLLSAVRIKAEGYATRCSTVLMIDKKGWCRIHERTFDVAGSHIREFELQL